ncbi:MAG: class I SAM-dependent methyltransferase [Leptolyngbyaceae bacterium]|nr:class I SAM-dependent methyltransferase [Leptolyngbyaceae bacterium]
MMVNPQSLSKSAHQNQPELCRAIAQRIQDDPHQRITFAEFMELALYHPDHGYYTSPKQRIGGKGDFVTSPHLGSDFGELLAEQCAEMWNLLGRPHPFHLVEMGAGQGLIVRDVLNYLHRVHFDCFEATEYLIIEKSATLIREQRLQTASLADAQSHIRWCTWDDLLTDSITGCFFSNELVDAFPVHQLILDNGQWQEIYVTLTPSSSSDSSYTFTEISAPLSTPDLESYFSWMELDIDPARYPNGYRTEVNLAALDWVDQVANRLHRGYVLTIDYGYSASRYYSPARAQGTLQCYYQHAHHSNPYQHIGHQDITAHVNFTALERRGEAAGLKTLGRIEQGLFLMALGLGDRLSALSNPATIQSLSANELLQRRDALHALMNPMGLGNFQVLLQGKALPNGAIAQTLKGFTIPPM